MKENPYEIKPRKIDRKKLDLMLKLIEQSYNQHEISKDELLKDVCCVRDKTNIEIIEVVEW
jgi:hypothetical protein